MLMLWLMACSDGEPVELIEVEEPAVEDIVVLSEDEIEAEPEEELTDPEEEVDAEPGSEEEEAPEEATEAHENAPEPQDIDPTEPEEEDLADAEAEEEEAEEEVAAALPAKTLTYALKPKGSSLYVQVFKDRTTAGADLSHDHVMLATGWTGSATWNADDLSQCSIEVTLRVDKLAVDPPNLRTALDIEGELSDGQRADVKKNMLAKDQLDAATYPEITFTSSKCEAKGEKVKVTGTLTIHGTPKTISTTMTITATDESFSARGGFKVKQSDFGIEPFSAMLGALKNEDQMKFTVSLQGEP